MSRLSPMLLIGVLSISACSDDTTLIEGPDGVEFLTQNAEGTPGWLLDESIEVRVTNIHGAPVAGAWVHWSSTTDGAFFAEESTQTDVEGIASVDFAPGWSLGAQQVTATVDNASDILQVTATGMEFTATEVLDRRVCGLDTEGRLWCWPEYSHEVHPMRLDDARRPIPAATALRFVALRSDAGAPPSDRDGLCAITASGEVWCTNAAGFSGPHHSASSVPTLHQVQTPAPVADFAIGGNFARNQCMIDTDGFAWCRGQNHSGQLGDGTTTDSDTWQPVQGNLRFAEITVGARDACAITLNGEPYCWGANDGERLGISPAASSVTMPTPVDGDLRLQRISQASSGLCGITAFVTPELICWGSTFPAQRVNTQLPSGIQGIPTTASSLAGDWAGGRIVHDGRLYRFGYNGGWVADFEFNAEGAYPLLEPNVTDVVRLLSRTSYYWCVEHTTDATICSTVNDRPVAVPLPE